MTLYLWLILGYLLVLMALNFIRARRVKSQEDFMVAGRTLSVPVMVFTLVCTWIGSGTFIAGAEYAYRAALVWRRLGHVIDGDNQLGYRWRGCRRPRFLDVAWASQWPDVPPAARQHRRRQPLDGQLRWREAIRS